jgi:hypothetical protein
MQAVYYDRDGRPVSGQRWEQLSRRPGYSRVGYSDTIWHGQQAIVITFWSGIAAGDGPAGPLIFCTCAGVRALTDRRAAYQRLWRWPDIVTARDGHRAVTAWITEVAGFLAGTTSQFPPPGPALPAYASPPGR